MTLDPFEKMLAEMEEINNEPVTPFVPLIREVPIPTKNPTTTSKSNPKHLAYIGPGVDKDRVSDDWYTPTQYIEKARRAMGSIDLDPFSSTKANETVKAKRFFTEQNPAQNNDWANEGKPVNVFANPPYGRSTLAPALASFVKALQEGKIAQAIILINNITESAWAQTLASHANAVCFVAGRISFWNADGKNVSGNTRGQFFWYFGSEIEKFNEEFSDIGIIYLNHNRGNNARHIVRT